MHNEIISSLKCIFSVHLAVSMWGSAWRWITALWALIELHWWEHQLQNMVPQKIFKPSTSDYYIIMCSALIECQKSSLSRSVHLKAPLGSLFISRCSYLKCFSEQALFHKVSIFKCSISTAPNILSILAIPSFSQNVQDMWMTLSLFSTRLWHQYSIMSHLCLLYMCSITCSLKYFAVRKWNCSMRTGSLFLWLFFFFFSFGPAPVPILSWKCTLFTLKAETVSLLPFSTK